MRPATLAGPQVPDVHKIPNVAKVPDVATNPDVRADPDRCLAGGGAPDDHFDALQDLGDEIATLAAHIHAAEHRFLTLIAEFDRLRGWEPGGHRSCAHWLAFRTGIDLGAARERVRASRALLDLPRISASMAQGELSFTKVRALTRVATRESEGELLELAHSCTAAQLERVVRAWRSLSRHDEAELERMRHRSRYFSVFPDEEGMYLVRGGLDPEVGAMLMRAVDAAGDALYRESASSDPAADATADSAADPATDPAAGPATDIEPKQRRADAVGLVAERALAVGFGQERAEDGRDDSAPLSGTRTERYQVVLHVESLTLQAETEPGRSDLEDGTRVSAETSRRLSCDAAVVPLTESPDGSILDVGRKTRTIPPALRRALESRDRGCRFPGCGLRFTDAHHVRHWADGGQTKLDNLVLLCRFHHRLVHEEGYTMHSPRGERLYFLDPTMRMIPDRPAPTPPLPPRPAEALIEQNRARSIEPNYATAAARYKCEDDIPPATIAQAIEALESSPYVRS